MNIRNVYPVIFKDFLTIKSTGGYVIFYSILDDRIHFEMNIENATVVSQKFLDDIDNEMTKKAENYKADKISMFLRTTLNDATFYKYYPTEEMKLEMKKLKLYKEIVVRETSKGEFRAEDLKIFESEQLIKAFNGNKLIMKAEKVK